MFKLGEHRNQATKSIIQETDLKVCNLLVRFCDFLCNTDFHNYSCPYLSNKNLESPVNLNSIQVFGLHFIDHILGYIMVYWQGWGYMVLRSKPASVSNCSEGIDVNPVGFFVFFNILSYKRKQICNHLANL